MKKSILIYLMFLGLFVSACSAGRLGQADKPRSSNIIAQQGEEDSYDLHILDPGFSRWFATYGRPIGFHAPAYYEQWNMRYVTQWNQLVNSPIYRGGIDNPFQNHIDYQSNVDYGLKLNHELYWYFRYIESLYGNYYDFGFGRGNRIL